jgi:parallel beta-helix repeat protein
MPIIDQLEEEYAEKLAFIHINVTERPDYAEEFGVSALPTMFVISDKKGERYAKEEISGFTEQTRLREIIALGREDGSDDVGNGANENQDPADKDGDISAMARQPVQPLEPMAPVDTATTARVDEHLIVLEDGRDGVTVTAKNCGGTTTCACGDTVTSDYTLEADLDCDCGSLGLKVGANGIHIDGNGHAITGPTGVEFSWGIDNIVGKDYVTISNLTIVGFVTGIRLYGAANHNKIRDNSIATCDTGISLVDSTDNEITYNYIHNNKDGIAISGGSSNTIRRNTIDINTHYGIHLRGYPAGTSGNTVSSNAVCGNVEKDIVVSSESTGNHGNNFCDDLTASGNAITCSKSCDERGCVADAHPTTVFTCGDTVTESCTFNSDLYCSLSNGLTVGADDVTIDGDGYRLINHFCLSHWQPSGIKNDGHNNGAVMHLTVKKFYRGIYLYSHADGNKIKGCTIDDNGYGVYISNSKNNQLLPIIREPLPPKYNYIVNNGKGIYLSDADDNLISHSYINDNRVEGISVYTSDDNRIEDSHINDNGYYGIYISYADDNRVEDNTIKNNGDDGIYMEYSEDNIVSDNQITQNNMHGVYIYSSSYNTITDNTANTNDGKGIYLKHSSDNNILTDNTANSNDAGIYLDQSDNNVLIDNIANWNKYGFVLYNASRNTLTGNTASSNRYHGIQLSHVSNNNNIINNQIGNSVYQHGVYIAYSNNTLIQDNEISKNDDYGLYFFCANYNIVSNNTINDNKYGIYLGSYSSHNLINVNRIIKNRNGIYFYSSAFSFPRNTTISNNYICNNKNKDIINNPLGSNIGWLNYCDTVSNWDDSSSSGGCMYSCGELNCTDNDGDGYPIFDIFECPIGNDCDDNNASINPGADEIYCNDRDEDCNAVYECSCSDNDDDGAPALTDTCPLGFDCDDSDPNRYPGAREINCNGIDENCDGEDQCECTDNDGDGYAIEGGDCGLGGEVDCNDEDINIHPNAAEIYCNGVDEDCSGSDDCNCVDEDGDGYDLRNAYYCPTGTDCDDVRDYIHPGRAEICYNYIDENCNGMIDEGCNISCYTDDDCSDGRICAEDNICRCPNGELDFLVNGDVITVCDPVGVPVDTPCEHGWPHHEGSNVNLGDPARSIVSETVPACDLFEVNRTNQGYNLLSHAEEARDCCVDYFENGVISPGCHADTNNAYAQSGLATALNYDNLRRCIGLYEIYGLGSRAEYMQGYYRNEVWCGADTIWGVRGDSCLGRAPGTPGTSGDLNYCCNIDKYKWTWCWGICWPECWGNFEPVNCYDGVHANTDLLRCTWDPGRIPDGWTSDTDLGANSCCFAHLPAHVSTEILSTGTCVDYSVVLTTLLRMSGYKQDEVYTTISAGPENPHSFNLIRFPGDSNYTLVDTVGNCDGYHPMALPGLSTKN